MLINVLAQIYSEYFINNKLIMEPTGKPNMYPILKPVERNIYDYLPLSNDI
jgi:hypothetical protein